MEKVDFSKYACHGLAGMEDNFKQSNAYKEQELRRIITAAILDEIGEFNPNYDKARGNLTRSSNGIVAKFCNISGFNSRILFGLYRLIYVLKTHSIETFEDVLKGQKPLVINEGNQLGVFKCQNILCFAVKGAKLNPLVNGKSCDPKGAWGLFIEDSISVVLPYDDCFKAYKKSDELDGIFDEEIRIEGSIRPPKIYAVSLPVTYGVGNSPNRRYTIQYWRNTVEFIRHLLTIYDYKDVFIVDSMSGYNLENKEVIAAYQALGDTSNKFEKPHIGGFSVHAYDELTLLERTKSI